MCILIEILENVIPESNTPIGQHQAETEQVVTCPLVKSLLYQILTYQGFQEMFTFTSYTLMYSLTSTWTSIRL